MTLNFNGSKLFFEKTASKQRPSIDLFTPLSILDVATTDGLLLLKYAIDHRNRSMIETAVYLYSIESGNILGRVIKIRVIDRLYRCRPYFV